MREWKSQSHVKWYCKYHIVFSPKYRKKAMFGSLRKGVGKILRELCNQSGVELVEGHAMSDHVHLCLSIPVWSKYSNAQRVISLHLAQGCLNPLLCGACAVCCW